MDNNPEIWKDIPGYEGFYQVSDQGRVKSLSRSVLNGNRYITLKEKILKPSQSRKGYLKVNLYREKKVKSIPIHKIVAIVFLNHIPSGMETVVDHKNECITDNHVDNLQLITNRENLSRSKKGCSSKYTGVTWDKSRGLWLSSIIINGKNKHLGRFSNELDAKSAYEEYLLKL